MPNLRATLAWLFSLRGRVTAARFLGVGLLLLALKVGLDAALCRALGLPPWSPLLYVTPLPWPLLRADVGWKWALFALPSLAFCWIGVAMTFRRLRDAGWSDWLLLAFFAPYANLCLFAVLAALPSRAAAAAPAGASAAGESLPRWLPAALAAAVTVGFSWLSFGLLADYGGILFFGLPMMQGLIVGMTTRDRHWPESLGQLALSLVYEALLLLTLALEGLLCIAMAVPPWFLCGLLGVCVGRAITPLQRGRAWVGLLAVPLLQCLEPAVAPPATVFEARTEVVVQAAPERVWQSLVTFDRLPPPTELLFRLGIAYPTHATITGRGPGAVRHCSFTTGDFVEPIEVWDEPRLLRFAVTQCPPPMQEWNPFHGPEEVHAAHLHGYFQARQGQFELTPQPDGTTRLVGTTWYSHGLRPEPYWRLWSDLMVHAIHRRVLDHIRREAER